MQLSLPPALEDLVRAKVASGLYRDETDVVSEALRLLDRSDGEEIDWDKLEFAVAEGEADLAAGRYADVGSAAELRAYMKAE